METENKRSYGFVKKWAPIAAIVLLTVALMFYFKSSNIGYVSIQNPGRDIIAEYTQNLIPVYSKTELTKEDLVNFAFYENLPLDKENNTVLQIKPDMMGRERFFLKTAAINPKTNNYGRFVKKLNLNKNEIAVFDSILNVYGESIYQYVLYNENNALAVNPNLPILQKAMSTDIYDFLKSRVYEKSNVELPENYATLNRDKIRDVLAEKENLPVKEFIFIAPDTVFQHEYNTEVEDYLAQLPEAGDAAPAESSALSPEAETTDSVQINVSSPVIRIENEDLARNHAHYNIDSNYYVVEIPEEYYTAEGLPDYDSLRVSLESLAGDLNSISLNFDFDQEGKFNMDFSDFTNVDSLRTFNLEFNLKNLSSFITETMETAYEYDDGDWEDFGLKVDSLARSLEFVKIDSLKLIKIKEYADSLEQIEKRLEKNR